MLLATGIYLSGQKYLRSSDNDPRKVVTDNRTVPAKAKLTGRDWGAVIAWQFAIRKARPLSRLIIMNVPHPACLARELRTWRQLRKSWYVFFFQLPWLPERILTTKGAEAVQRLPSRNAAALSQFGPPC